MLSLGECQLQVHLESRLQAPSQPPAQTLALAPDLGGLPPYHGLQDTVMEWAFVRQG